jgi:hypothetical protein
VRERGKSKGRNLKGQRCERTVDPRRRERGRWRCSSPARQPCTACALPRRRAKDSRWVHHRRADVRVHRLDADASVRHPCWTTYRAGGDDRPGASRPIGMTWSSASRQVARYLLFFARPAWMRRVGTVPPPPAVAWYPAVRVASVHAATMVTSGSIRRLSSSRTTRSGRLPSANRPGGSTAWGSPAASSKSTRRSRRGYTQYVGRGAVPIPTAYDAEMLHPRGSEMTLLGRTRAGGIYVSPCTKLTGTADTHISRTCPAVQLGARIADENAAAGLAGLGPHRQLYACDSREVVRQRRMGTVTPIRAPPRKSPWPRACPLPRPSRPVPEHTRAKRRNVAWWQAVVESKSGTRAVADILTAPSGTLII